MAELTLEMVRAIDRCSAATLIALRQQYPREARWLYTTMIARAFIDMIEDSPGALDVIIDMFNETIAAPVVMMRRTQ